MPIRGTATPSPSSLTRERLLSAHAASRATRVVYIRKPVVLPGSSSSSQYHPSVVAVQSGGRSPSGFVFHGSKVDAAPGSGNGDDQFTAYLGRPGSPYSTGAFIHCFLGKVVDPSGWLLGSYNGTTAPETLYFAEYRNKGIGAMSKNRVILPGYRLIKKASEASVFTVDSFINGGQWLPDTSLKYVPGLF
ncbi:hypothetical protein H6P81_017661 [Aristolochia fimbriata]|uniref:Pectinesterase catalytic domain-containing protein n=1 Tax=Aristolochia fimbriata TaxID=158543 RepID=A0AAV7E331_ARIFI|nr:hypothetical protein H6P81_017661 [Aristolochia fimbriata]